MCMYRYIYICIIVMFTYTHAIVGCSKSACVYIGFVMYILIYIYIS